MAPSSWQFTLGKKDGKRMTTLSENFVKRLAMSRPRDAIAPTLERSKMEIVDV
jgi:hypothetical protein